MTKIINDLKKCNSWYMGACGLVLVRSSQLFLDCFWH